MVAEFRSRTGCAESRKPVPRHLIARGDEVLRFWAVENQIYYKRQRASGWQRALFWHRDLGLLDGMSCHVKSRPTSRFGRLGELLLASRFLRASSAARSSLYHCPGTYGDTGRN